MQGGWCVTPPAPNFPGFTFDASHWVAKLDASVKTLDDAITATADEERQAHTTLVKKNEAIAEYDNTFSCNANLVSVLLEGAGEKDLARRGRPSTRRRGQTVEDANQKNPE